MNIKRKVLRATDKLISYLNKKDVSSDFIIFDDVFPNPLSDWRYNEYLHYLNNIPNTSIISNITNTQFKDIAKYTDQFYTDYPHFKNKIIKHNPYHVYKAKLGYCLFYNNLKIAYNFFETNNIPFIFTLYPGGGFHIYDKKIEKSLEYYFSSHLFRHVIVNMPHVYDYLISQFNLHESKISLIYGVPINLPHTCSKRFHDGKINVLFSSHKYSSNGIDKGFDVFNRVAKILENDSRFTFTVIGGFTQNDLIVSSNKITFISELVGNTLSEVMQNYDIILSPNRSHILHLGAFDGFPTGSVLHAVNSGCLMMITDDWDNSDLLGLIDGVDFIKISTSVNDIIMKLKQLADEPARIENIANNGKNKLTYLVKSDSQLIKREHIISKYL